MTPRPSGARSVRTHACPSLGAQASGVHGVSSLLSRETSWRRPLFEGLSSAWAPTVHLPSPLPPAARSLVSAYLEPSEPSDCRPPPRRGLGSAAGLGSGGRSAGSAWGPERARGPQLHPSPRSLRPSPPSTCRLQPGCHVTGIGTAHLPLPLPSVHESDRPSPEPVCPGQPRV